MNPFIQQIVSQKIKSLTPNELINYANTYQIQLTEKEAVKIIEILQEEKKIDIYNKKQHKNVIHKVEKRVSPQLAKKANQLLEQFSNIF